MASGIDSPTKMYSVPKQDGDEQVQQDGADNAVIGDAATPEDRLGDDRSESDCDGKPGRRQDIKVIGPWRIVEAQHEDDDICRETDKHHGQSRRVVGDDEHASDDRQQGGNREALKHENSHGLKRCEDEHREHEHDGQQREQPVRIHAPQSADFTDATHNPMHFDGMITFVVFDGESRPMEG